MKKLLGLMGAFAGIIYKIILASFIIGIANSVGYEINDYQAVIFIITAVLSEWKMFLNLED